MNEKESNRFSCRAEQYDASTKGEWINKKMYDFEDMVDYYDTLKSPENLSTFNSVLELEILDLIQFSDAKSILDLGCGAGAFYHLVSSVYPGIEYKGYDLSELQIKRAKMNFGSFFETKDISSIVSQEFSSYDVIHAYSVFSFLSVQDQLRTIGNILNSSAKTIISTGVTIPDIKFAPTSFFKDFGGRIVDGKNLMTAISFPLKNDLLKIVDSTKHVITFHEKETSSTRAINNSDHSGSMLGIKKEMKARNKEFEAKTQFPKKWRYFLATIRPSDWDIYRSKSLDDMPIAEVRAMIMERLNSAVRS